MPVSRRAFVMSAVASGIALNLKRLAVADVPGFAVRETLPGQRVWNPAVGGAGRIESVVKNITAPIFIKLSPWACRGGDGRAPKPVRPCV